MKKNINNFMMWVIRKYEYIHTEIQVEWIYLDRNELWPRISTDKNFKWEKLRKK